MVTSVFHELNIDVPCCRSNPLSLYFLICMRLGKPRQAESNCKDRYPQCKNYHAHGECDRNPGWMIMFCPESCNACELRDPKIRCDRSRLNITTTPVYAPGDMNRMFENIFEEFKEYNPEILSSPAMGQGKPWVVTFDNFLSDQEIDALISTNNNFERSTDTGSTNEFGETGRILSKSRTSSNSWCRGACLAHPDVQAAIRRIEAVTKVPSGNYESFQVLKYEVGQRYGVHHDFGGQDRGLACGPRILTFFLYLSDVEEGGETAFPSLGLSVQPKKGKALLWPSTLDSDPSRQEPTTIHEARPVIKGVKYAANSWIHLYNYEVPNLWGCTGTFDELS